MANGDLVTGPYEFEFRDTKLGGRTEFAWIDSNLANLPDVTTSDLDLIRRHGELGGSDFHSGRTIDLSFELSADIGRDGFIEVVRRFRETFVSGTSTSRLYMSNPAVAAGEKVFIEAVPRAIDLPTDLQFYEGLKVATVRLRAHDPRFYAVDEGRATGIETPTSIGNRPWVTEWPREWGTTFTSGSFLAVNRGNIDAPMSFRIDGPCIDPVILNVDTGEYLRMSASIVAGQTIEFDMTGTAPVALIAGANGYHRVSSLSTWLTLAPGSNVFKFSSLDGNGTLSAEWRSTWV